MFRTVIVSVSLHTSFGSPTVPFQASPNRNSNNVDPLAWNHRRRTVPPRPVGSGRPPIPYRRNASHREGVGRSIKTMVVRRVGKLDSRLSFQCESEPAGLFFVCMHKKQRVDQTHSFRTTSSISSYPILSSLDPNQPCSIATTTEP